MNLKKPEQEMLTIYSVKTKIFETLYLNIYIKTFANLFLVHNNLIHNNHISGAMNASRKLQLLESD